MRNEVIGMRHDHAHTRKSGCVGEVESALLVAGLTYRVHKFQS